MMTFEESTSLFAPFPARSVTLLTGPTSIGKSFFLSRILEHCSLYFSEPVNRIVVVLCNERVPPYTLEGENIPPLVHVPLSEFNFEDLEALDILIIEDLQSITSEVRQSINVVTHHFKLNCCFVVTHNLLGNVNFELLSLVHRVIFFLKSTAVSRTAKYVVRHFFQDKETRDYLQSIVGFCERIGEPLLIETSPIQQPSHIAISHITQFARKGFSCVYPHPRMNILYQTSQSDPGELKSEHLNESPSELLPNTYIVFSSSALDQERKKRITLPLVEEEEDCAEKKEWEQLTLDVEERIEAYFPVSKHFVIKNLAREILSHHNFCISSDARMVHLKKHPNTTRVPLLDYLAVATRPLAPSENVDKTEYLAFRKMTHALLERGAPAHLIKNRFLHGKDGSSNIKSSHSRKKKKMNLQPPLYPPRSLPYQYYQ